MRRCSKSLMKTLGACRIRGLALLAAASLLANCAADAPTLDQITVGPGYYDTLDCPELVAKLQSLTVRVRELILLTEESSGDSGGTTVNAVANNTEYAKARADQRQAENAAVWKRCDLSAKPSKSTADQKPIHHIEPGQRQENRLWTGARGKPSPFLGRASAS